MARPARIEYGGAVYHVLNRGNCRQDLFAVGNSGVSFEQTLFDACARFGWCLHAYGLSKAIAQECRSRRQAKFPQTLRTPISKA